MEFQDRIIIHHNLYIELKQNISSKIVFCLVIINENNKN